MHKIALEEHFGLPDLTQYSSVGQFGFTKESAKDIEYRLQEFAEMRLQAMDEGNISKTIISHTAPGIEAARAPKQAVSDANKINDCLARQIEANPDRFGGFATIPLQSPQEAADELERAVKQVGFHGTHLNGHMQEHYLDEDRYRVFWERLVDLDGPVYLHPTYCATKAAMHSYTVSLRYQLRTTTTQVIELILPQVQTNLRPGYAEDPRAMPLAGFAAEVMEVLEQSQT